MVVVPAGEFMMGSPESEKEQYDNEGPVHRVSVRQPFAIGKNEVTRGQFTAFANATSRGEGSCYYWDVEAGEAKQDERHTWRSPGYAQTVDDPVVCISYEDAKAYTVWLSHKTGHAYRLPSEAEWEYAARATTRSARYWGASADEACGYANVHDRTSKRVNKFDWTAHDCDDGYAQTSPAGSFRANAFGLHDMLGNVWEWTEDCWNKSYAGAPSDTNVWKAGDCSRRVLRGGSWVDAPRYVRSANRYGNDIEYRYVDFGFRIARTLP
jgi:formylglycine-generating enzyme required for sulfatase activity